MAINWNPSGGTNMLGTMRRPRTPRVGMPAWEPPEGEERPPFLERPPRERPPRPDIQPGERPGGGGGGVMPWSMEEFRNMYPQLADMPDEEIRSMYAGFAELLGNWGGRGMDFWRERWKGLTPQFTGRYYPEGNRPGGRRPGGRDQQLGLQQMPMWGYGNIVNQRY